MFNTNCLLFQESFTDPVVTRCKHYFCEKCALANYKKSQRCAACGKQTNGMFNPAKEIVAKLAKMKSKEEEDKKKQEAGGISDSD